MSTSPVGGNLAPVHLQVAVPFTVGLGHGIYLCTFAFCVRWLLFSDEGWKFRRHINWPAVLITFIIFVLSFAWTAADLKNIMDAVHHATVHSPDTPYVPKPWVPIIRCTAVNTTALLTDSVLIYRCWAIYERKFRIIIFPCILWLGGLACSILRLYLQIMQNKNPFSNPVPWADVNMSVGPGIVLTPFWGSTLVLGAYCTCLLIRRIYQVTKKFDRASCKDFRLISRIFAESGTLYLSTTLANFIVWFTSNNLAIQVTTKINPAVIGIAFNLILIRIGHNKAQEAVKSEMTKIVLSTLVFDTSTLNPYIGGAPQGTSVD